MKSVRNSLQEYKWWALIKTEGGGGLTSMVGNYSLGEGANELPRVLSHQKKLPLVRL